MRASSAGERIDRSSLRVSSSTWFTIKSINLNNQRVEESSHFSPSRTALDQEEAQSTLNRARSALQTGTRISLARSANDVLAGSARMGRGYAKEKCDNEGNEYRYRSGGFYFDVFRPCKIVDCAPVRADVLFLLREKRARDNWQLDINN